jgi:hypothetical protein
MLGQRTLKVQKMRDDDDGGLPMKVGKIIGRLDEMGLRMGRYEVDMRTTMVRFEEKIDTIQKAVSANAGVMSGAGGAVKWIIAALTLASGTVGALHIWPIHIG